MAETSLHYAFHTTQIWQSLFKATIAISTFGGSITFQVIFQQVDGEPENEHDTAFRFEYKDSRSFLAGAWAAFLIALAVSCVGAVVLTIRHQEIIAGFKTRVPRGWALFVVVAGFIAVEGLIWAFFVSSLAVTAYSNKTGWATAAFAGLCALVTLIFWPVLVSQVISLSPSTSDLLLLVSNRTLGKQEGDLL